MAGSKTAFFLLTNSDETIPKGTQDSTAAAVYHPCTSNFLTDGRNQFGTEKRTKVESNLNELKQRRRKMPRTLNVLLGGVSCGLLILYCLNKRANAPPPYVWSISLFIPLALFLLVCLLAEQFCCFPFDVSCREPLAVEPSRKIEGICDPFAESGFLVSLFPFSNPARRTNAEQLQFPLALQFQRSSRSKMDSVR